jgi:hypothetical protein
MKYAKIIRVGLTFIGFAAASAAQSAICYVPPDVLGLLGQTLAFRERFKLEPFAAHGIDEPRRTIQLQYAYATGRLYFYLPSREFGFGYAPEYAAEPGGTEIMEFVCPPPQDASFLDCVALQFGPPPRAENGGKTYPGIAAGPNSRPLPPFKPAVPTVCSTTIEAPVWSPSPQSPFKEYVIGEIREALKTEIPGTLRRAFISDFNLDDPRILIYTEADVPGEGRRRVLLRSSFSRHRVAHPVDVIRAGASWVAREDEATVAEILKHGIQIYP